MSKVKRTRQQPGAGDDPRATRATEAVDVGDAPATPDVLRFEVPYIASSPRLINPSIGLASLVPSRQPDATYVIDVTLLDSPDHRLIRCGVLLAHRVRDGLGEWYLSADGWSPHLSGEQTEPMGQGDLPERFADLVRPFRRIGPLGPVAALTADRRESVFTDVSGHPLATVRDEKVTIRRGGLTTARFREVTVSPIGAGLNDQQQGFLIERLTTLGASQVVRFAPLVQRLGAPANGRNDFPEPRPIDTDDSVSAWLANLIAARLRVIVAADLSIRGGDATHVPALVRSAARLRAELGGLADLLDRSWLADIDEELDWLVSTPEPDVPGRLRSEFYLTLLDHLVTAARGPQIGDLAGQRAKAALRDVVGDAVNRLSGRVQAVSAESPLADWQMLHEVMQQVLDAGVVAAHLNPKQVRRIRDRLLPLRDSLAACTGADLDDLAETARASSPDEAFALGREYERELAGRVGRRQAWLHGWARQSARLST